MDLGGLLGGGREEVERRLGPPDAARDVGRETWLVYRRPGLALRIRLSGSADRDAGRGRPEGRAPGGRDGSGDEGTRVRSWIATLDRGRPRLRDAVEPLGLWPACAPDVRAGEVEGPMARRVLRPGGEDVAHSLTVTVGAGGFVRVAAFDEPPEWL